MTGLFGGTPDFDAGIPSGSGGAEDHLEYELDDWAVESRRMLAQLLVGHGVAHVWEAGRLVVPETHEEVVDDLVDQVAATFAGTLDDPEVPRVVFDISDIDPALIDELCGAIGDAGIEWAVDTDGTLVVPAEHVVTVEQFVERLEFPHALPLSESAGSSDSDRSGDAPDEPPGVDIDPDRVLGGLYVAADRLSRSATDPRGVMTAVDLAAELAEARPPFGVESQGWERLKESAAGLAVLLTSIESTDDDVERAAMALRNQLRSYV